MATLQIDNVPSQLVEYVRLLDPAKRRMLEEEVVFLLQKSLTGPQRREQARLALDNLKRNRITRPAGSPDSVELLREDRER